MATKPAKHKMRKRIQEMIRVDHAGEHGAVMIYRGQAAVFHAIAAKSATADMIDHMAAQEQAHLDYFDKLVLEHNIRPTALAPLWHIAGFGLGAITALMGEKAAMACTVAVEEVIDTHYAEQTKLLDSRKEESELSAMIKKFRADEAEHCDMARTQGAEQATGYALMQRVIGAGCRAAIKLSEKI